MGKNAVSEWSRLLGEFWAANRLTACEDVCWRNRRAVEAFVAATGIQRPADITAAAVEAYLGGLLAQGKSPKTVRNHKASISRFCQWAKRQGLLTSNPAREVEPPALDEQIPHALSRRDLAAALRIAKHHGFACEVALAAYTGLRLSEMRRLRWADVDFSARTLIVRKRKNHRPLIASIHRFPLRRLIRQRARWPETDYVFPGGRDRRDGSGGKGQWQRRGMRNMKAWLRMIKPLQEALPAFRALPKGCVGRGWHLFRHTFATAAFKRGVDVRKVQKWMGHRCIAQTLRYTHVAEGYDEEIERL